MMYKHIERKIKKYVLEVLALKTEPHDIALGFALGVFIGLMPTPGLNILFGIAVVLLHKKLNKLTLFGGMAVFNPLTVPPLVLIYYNLGRIFVKPLDPTALFYPVIRQVLHTSFTIFTGALIIAVPMSILSYILLKRVVVRYRLRMS